MCARLCARLHPYAREAATLRTRGCHPVYEKLQPHIWEAATSCADRAAARTASQGAAAVASPWWYGHRGRCCARHTVVLVAPAAGADTPRSGRASATLGRGTVQAGCARASPRLSRPARLHAPQRERADDGDRRGGMLKAPSWEHGTLLLPSRADTAGSGWRSTLERSGHAAER